MTRRAFVASVVVAIAALASSCTSPNSAEPTTPVSTTIASAGPTAGGGSRDNALVTRVVDGDTVEARFGGRPLTVRLIGIDTPESVAPDQPVQCLAHQASAYTTERLEGARVRLQFDLERIDPFGRTLAYVWLGDELFNETLVREGYAFVTTYPPNVRYVDRFRAAQREPVRQSEACGEGASTRARAIRPTRRVHPATAARPGLFGRRRAQVHGVASRSPQLRRGPQRHRVRGRVRACSAFGAAPAGPGWDPTMDELLANSEGIPRDRGHPRIGLSTLETGERGLRCPHPRRDDGLAEPQLAPTFCQRPNETAGSQGSLDHLGEISVLLRPRLDHLVEEVFRQDHRLRGQPYLYRIRDINSEITMLHALANP